MNNSDKKDKQHKEEIKMQKAMDDVMSILNRHCEQGEMDKEVHDKLSKEMERIFRKSIEEEKQRMAKEYDEEN